MLGCNTETRDRSFRSVFTSQYTGLLLPELIPNSVTLSHQKYYHSSWKGVLRRTPQGIKFPSGVLVSSYTSGWRDGQL